MFSLFLYLIRIGSAHKRGDKQGEWALFRVGTNLANANTMPENKLELIAKKA